MYNWIYYGFISYCKCYCCHMYNMWLVCNSYYDSTKRFINKKKEIRISYLINAFRRIEDASQRRDNDKLLQLESAIADIQLFGTKKQVELSRKFAMEFANSRSADAMPLLYNLCDDLRKELNLEALTNTQWICLRITNRDRK